MRSLCFIAGLGFTQSLQAAAGLAPSTMVFADDFSGPFLNPVWQASLPNAGLSGATAAYVGPAGYSFQSLDGASVLRMTDTLDPLQRRGWSTTTTFSLTNFRYEARFNSLVQSLNTSIDAFIEIWLLDPTNPNRYDIVSPFAGGYGTDRNFLVNSGVDGNYLRTPFAFQDNTWYRLVLAADEGQNLRASICSDAGVELIGYTFAHGASAYSSGFRLALSQGMHVPTFPCPSDVALDYVTLTTIPEPGTFTLVTCFLFAVLVGRNRR